MTNVSLGSHHPFDIGKVLNLDNPSSQNMAMILRMEEREKHIRLL